MNNELRMLRIEVRRNTALLFFPVITVIVGFIVNEVRPKGIWIWLETSGSIQFALILVGPLAGGLAAWMATRNRRRGVVELLATTPYPAARRDLATWLATALCVGLAYLAAAMVFIVLTFWNATWGFLFLPSILITLLGLAAHSALGYAIAYYLPSIFVVSLVPILLYCIQVIPDVFFLGSSIQYLSPLGSGPTHSVFYGMLPDISAEQSLWLLGLTGVAAAAVALKRQRSVAHYGALLTTIAMVITGAAMLVGTPVQVNPAQKQEALIPYKPSCKKGLIPVCVHPAYEEMLTETTTVVNEVAKPLIGIPGGPTRAEQRLNQSGFVPGGTLPLYLVDESSGTYDQLAMEISQELVIGDSAGDSPSVSLESNKRLQSNKAQDAIQTWLLQQAGRGPKFPIGIGTPRDTEMVNAAAKRFGRLTRERQKEWLRENYADLRSGKLTLKDLP